MDDAIERARENPNVALSQWFCDKGTIRGTPQLILPVSLKPPSLNVDAGLVLGISTGEDSDDSSSAEQLRVIYHAKTILFLDMVFSNVFVLQPRGGHWLHAGHEQVSSYQRRILQGC